MKSTDYDQVIVEHYDKEAQERGLDPTSTMYDLVVRERETQLVVRFVLLALRLSVRDGQKENEISICDVGCGNGFTLEALRNRLPLCQYFGFEFTPSLLELARKRFQTQANVKVDAGDVRQLQVNDGKYDIVICQRVLINLLDPADQRAALNELARVVRLGGFVLSIEAFQEPLERLNAARQEFDLDPLPPAHHNLYLSEDFYSNQSSLARVTGPTLDVSLPDDFLPSNFLSSHYFVARVLHPLALGPQRGFVRNSHFVRFMSEALCRPIGDYAPLKAYAFRKCYPG